MKGDTRSASHSGYCHVSRPFAPAHHAPDRCLPPLVPPNSCHMAPRADPSDSVSAGTW
ncbi:hypothetical protein OH76DRAFT_942726 [Lentinus brumalis]|uniref:Uncharacterized protein n=1 Tax=Lentinus brumalis TaxID=2498619 RepID=A0A371CZL4_9APHY|nr:hypothetical protein OH76DRAFT_942726 [Polyporus brumalis]